MYNLGEIREELPSRERPRMAVALIVFLAVIGTGLFVAVPILASETYRLRKAGRELDKLAATTPDYQSALKQSGKMELVSNMYRGIRSFSASAPKLQKLRLYLVPSRVELIISQIAPKMLVKSGPLRCVGELHFNGEKFAGGYNYVTGATYSAETTGSIR